MTTSRLALASLASTAVSSVVVVAWLLWTLLWPFDPLTKLIITVKNQPVIGGHLLVELDYCKSRHWAPREVRWALMNDMTVVLPVTSMSMPVGCHVKQIALPLSAHVPPGEYVLQEENIYQPWPWRTFTYVRRSQLFHVAKADQ